MLLYLRNFCSVTGKPQNCGPPVEWNGTAQEWLNQQLAHGGDTWLGPKLKIIIEAPKKELWAVLTKEGKVSPYTIFCEL